MLSKLLIKTFVKNHQDTAASRVRSSYGMLAGIVGIIANLILFGIKLSVGMISNSIALTADAFNNLSDCASSIITMLGFKLSSKPADKEHPFGHGRIEYISALMVAAMVMFVGFQFVRSSFKRIMNPSSVIFETIPFLLILFSVLTKLWLSKFNGYIGKQINSTALKASSFDALGDVIISSVVALSLLISLWTALPIDGFLGMLVSLFILYSGYTLVRETLNPILGESPDEELVKEIKKGLMSYKHIYDLHDLVIHNYGPGRCIATIHAEVPSSLCLVEIHEVIDKAERELSERLDIELVIHIDPVVTDNAEISSTKKQLQRILSEFSIIKSMHDFRIVDEGARKNILFDIVISVTKKFGHEQEDSLKNEIEKRIKQFCSYYYCTITVDKDFSNH